MNYLKYAKIIKEIVKKELEEVKVFVFGSVVKGEETPVSDIDILVVSRNMPEKMSERGRIKAKMWKRIGIFSPFEIHLVNEKRIQMVRKVYR